MKSIERITYIIIILTLALYSIQKSTNCVEYKTIKGDSISYKVIVEKPIIHDTIIYDKDTLWLVGDTIKMYDTVFVYNDYFKMYQYKLDTNISNVDVNINSFVTQNRLYGQELNIKNNRETTIVTNDLGYKFGIGMIVGKNEVSPAISYQYNRNNFGLGYNLVNGGILIKYEYKFNIKW